MIYNLVSFLSLDITLLLKTNTLNTDIFHFAGIQVSPYAIHMQSDHLGLPYKSVIIKVNALFVHVLIKDLLNLFIICHLYMALSLQTNTEWERFSFLYLDLYVLGDDAQISWGSFMQTKTSTCLDPHLN